MLYGLIRPLLFRCDPEWTHDQGLRAFSLAHRLGLASWLTEPAVRSPCRVMGLNLMNRVGLAAGLDKNGCYIDALSTFGFGFLEVGTVTPRPQPGNPKPRLYRIVPAHAIVNRMGFNNTGVDALLRNVGEARYQGILGINIGKNFDTPLERAADDYVHCLRKVYTRADYVTINVSSPNTANLRQLQHAAELERLLVTLVREREALTSQHSRRVPLAVKVAPDLSTDELRAIANILVEQGIDAVIATNTTTAREIVLGLPNADQTGGLSGAPLNARATQVVSQLAEILTGRIPIIAAGGILSGEDARQKIAAGASLVQLYTGLIYRGPRLVAEVARALADQKPTL
ncbi:MAG: quinone-dependent dihydroorotate dehydrogenase [Burkholderiales bacterium]